MMAQKIPRSWLFVAAIGIALGLALTLAQGVRKVNAPSASPADQGCVNQGSDRRECAPVICWLQRQMSWKSEHEPHFVLIGNPQGTNLGLAWPPYLVFNMPDGANHWRMFRIGFRYDRTWRGYIFPAIAAKRVSQPLRY
jgi:hypothetical protein